MTPEALACLVLQHQAEVAEPAVARIMEGLRVRSNVLRLFDGQAMWTLRGLRARLRRSDPGLIYTVAEALVLHGYLERMDNYSYRRSRR